MPRPSIEETGWHKHVDARLKGKRHQLRSADLEMYLNREPRPTTVWLAKVFDVNWKTMDKWVKGFEKKA